MELFNDFSVCMTFILSVNLKISDYYYYIIKLAFKIINIQQF